jgi:hypothetical protein
LSRFICEHVPINETKGHVIIDAVMAKARPERVVIPIQSSVFRSRYNRRFLASAEKLRSQPTFLMGKYAGFHEDAFFSEPIPCTSVLFGGVYIYIAFAL